MLKNGFLFLSTIILYFRTIFSQKCYNYTCSSLDNGLCELTKNDAILGEDIHILQECPYYSTCPWDDKSSKISCKAIPPQNLPSYPGGKCQFDKDCSTNKCQDKKCMGKAADAKCGNNSECLFGLACISGTCSAQKTIGLQCNSDYECLGNLACYKSSCTEFLSLVDGSKLEPKNSAFLCASGFAYKNECISIQNRDANLFGCDLAFPCNYTMSNETSLAIPNSCECIYNQYKHTHCILGNQYNSNYDTYLKGIKEAINNYEYCNAEEDRTTYCREYVKNSWDIKKAVINLKKQEIMALKGHKLKDADHCVMKVALGLDDTPPQARDGKWQCPKYNCEGENIDEQCCAISMNPFNEFGDNITISLNENACKLDSRCNIQFNLITSNWTANHYCIESELPKLSRKKFPGEACRKHDDCDKTSDIDLVGFCLDGFCSGLQESERCKSNSECIAGTFCNGIFCEKQKFEREFCLDRYQCQNSLGCLNNTCTSLNSQKKGTYLGPDADERLCQFGIINDKNGQCIEKKYYNMTAETSGFVKCELGQMCNYTTGIVDETGQLNLIKNPCECGYNEQGQDINDWKNYYRVMNGIYKNRCHTSARDKCYDELSDDIYAEQAFWKRKAPNAHLFYKSVDCAVKTLMANTFTPSLLLFIIELLIVFVL